MHYVSYQQEEVKDEPVVEQISPRPFKWGSIRPLTRWLALGLLCTLGMLMLYLALNPVHNVTELRTANVQDMSFGQLASESLDRTRVLHSFNNLLDDLVPGCAPMDIHKLRIRTGHLRDFVDLFAAAYFPEKKTDVWHLIRKDLAAGYGILGEFQDLVARGAPPDLTGNPDFQWNMSHIVNNVSESELTLLRDQSLEWKKNHLHLQRKVGFKDYISQPHLSHVYTGSRKMSKFFWGGLYQQPTDDHLGMYWVGTLLQCRLTGLDNQYPFFADITTITDEKDHLAFHNYRKSARALLAVARTVPSAFMSMASSDLETLQTLFHDLGKVNNVYNFYVHLLSQNQTTTPDYDEKRHRNDVKQTEKALNALLRQVQQWCAKQNVGHLGWHLKLQLVNYRPNAKC